MVHCCRAHQPTSFLWVSGPTVLATSSPPTKKKAQRISPATREAARGKTHHANAVGGQTRFAKGAPYLPTAQPGGLSQANPLLSIIINNYNYAAFLEQAIDSCLGQSYRPFEVIVVDDGSADDSPAIIRSYGDRIIPLLKPNGGQASAINAGFAISQGEVIVLLDADDYLFEDALSTLAAAWQANATDPSLIQMQCRLTLVGPAGEPIDLHPAPEIAFDQGDVRSQLHQRGRYSTTVTSGLSFHRRVLAEILPIPESDFCISADGYLVTLAPLFGSVGVVETAIGARRQHQNNLWAPLGKAVSLPRLHNSIRHDFLRYQYLSQALSQTSGEALPIDQLGLRDHLHLMARLPSRRLSPSQHPCPADQPGQLALQGVRSLWALRSYNMRRKLLLSGWFLWVGFAPRSWVRPVVDWLLVNGSRPRRIDFLLKILRRMTC